MKKILNRSYMPASEKGFTIVELLVAMTISLFVMGAVYSIYRSQQDSYVVQDQVAGAQQNLRAAMYLMTKEIRMAGYDPSFTGTPRRTLFGITTAGSNTITFTSDLDRDGDATDANETITYSLNTTTKTLLRTDGSGVNQTLAENIEAVGFAYSFDATGDGLIDMSANNNVIWAIDSDNDGNLDQNLDSNDDGIIDTNDAPAAMTSVSVTRIKAVTVWLLAKTDQSIKGYNVAKQYVVGSTTVSPSANFMYRLLMETSVCRNL